jgi:Ca2+-binding RTX toxin-like protein
VRRLLTTALIAALALVLASPALTKLVVGTPKNDNLRGTPAPDVIDGKAGNDTIRSLAGNDRLIGGPGNDKLYGNAGRDSYVCGGGHDVVFADEGEQVGRDCEVVHCRPVPPVPLPPLVTPGHYAAAGDFLSFDVQTDGRTISNFFVRLLVPCQPSTLRLSLPLTVTTSVPIQADRTFSLDDTSSTGFRPRVIAAGSFDAAGTASGTVTIQVSADFGGTHYDCQGSLPWSASRR